MSNRKVSWDQVAIKQFNKAIEYIAVDSVQNAEKVRTDLLEKIGAISKYPEKYPPDKYKIKQ